MKKHDEIMTKISEGFDLTNPTSHKVIKDFVDFIYENDVAMEHWYNLDYNDNHEVYITE